MSVLTVNYEASTVSFGGSDFPVVGLICPPHPKQPEVSASDRSLGGPVGGTKFAERAFEAIIPCENELLVLVTAIEGSPVLSVSMMHQSCYPYIMNDETLWLPLAVRLVGPTTLVADAHAPLARRPVGRVSWLDAEPDWTTELIHRLSKMTMPVAARGTPLCKMVTLSRLMEIRNEKIPGYV